MSQDTVKNKSVTINNSLNNGQLFHDHVNYADCDFMSSEPTGVEFRDCNFTESEFYTLYLDENTFINCTFTKCDFSQPIWSSVRFINCWFIQCSIDNDYDMDDVRFYCCAFMRTTFTNKAEQSYDDKLLFDKCSFTKTLFYNYCLDGSVFKNSVLKESEISSCSMKKVEIIDTNMINCELKGLHVSNNKWSSVRFKKCSWDGITFYQPNNFDAVVLMETKTKNCRGDTKTLSSFLVSPYCSSSGEVSSSSTLDSIGPPTKKSLGPLPVQLKKSKAPCRYISEGL